MEEGTLHNYILIKIHFLNDKSDSGNLINFVQNHATFLVKTYNAGNKNQKELHLESGATHSGMK